MLYVNLSPVCISGIYEWECFGNVKSSLISAQLKRVATNINCRIAVQMNYVDVVLTPRSVNASSARWRERELWRPRGHRVHLILTCTFHMMSPTENVIANTNYHIK